MIYRQGPWRYPMRWPALSAWRLGGLLGAALVLAACAPSGAAPGATSAAAERPAPGAPAPAATTADQPVQRMRVGYGSISGSMLPVWIAQDEGLYARQGLEVEPIYIAGAVKIAEALVGGEIAFGTTGASSAMGPGLEGADTIMVASWTNKLSFAAVVGPQIQSVADFRGKRVGTVRRGSNSEIWAAAVLGRFGLEPERDYTVLPIGGQPEQVAALQNGAIDVAVLIPPSNLYARKLGFRELLDAREYGLDYANVGPVTTRRYVREQPEALDRFLRASAEAVAMMFQEPATSLAVLGRYTQMDDPELLQETLDFELSRTSRDMIPSLASLRASLDEH